MSAPDGRVRLEFLINLVSYRLDELPLRERMEVFDSIRREVEAYIERRILEERRKKIREGRDG